MPVPLELHQLADTIAENITNGNLTTGFDLLAAAEMPELTVLMVIDRLHQSNLSGTVDHLRTLLARRYEDMLGHHWQVATITTRPDRSQLCVCVAGTGRMPADPKVFVDVRERQWTSWFPVHARDVEVRKEVW